MVYAHFLNRNILDIYSIPLAIIFLLITTGIYTGNNGLTGDFGLDYCNDEAADNNNIIRNEYPETTESITLAPNSFFACELGYINGIVDLGWKIYTEESELDSISDTYNGDIIILNHENYKNFVIGEYYGYSNFDLTELTYSGRFAGEEQMYEESITLHADSYFFVVNRDYRTTPAPEEVERGLFGPNSPTGTSEDSMDFHYVVILDYVEEE